MANNPTMIHLDKIVIDHGCNFLVAYYAASISKWTGKPSWRIDTVNSHSWLNQFGSYTIENFVDQSRLCVNPNGS